MPYRSNDDIYRALNVVRQFNSHQQAVDEAPYGLGSRAADTMKRINPFSKGGRIMAKNRKQSGNLANQVNDEWRALLGKKGYAKQAMGTVQDLRDFVQSKAPGTDVDAFLDKAGIPTATADAPVPIKLQDKFLLSIGQAMNAAGAGGTTGTADTTDTTATGSGGGGGGSRTRSAAELTGDATSRKGTRRAPLGSTPGADGATGPDGATGADGGEKDGGEPLAIDKDGDDTADPGSDPSVVGEPLPEPAPDSEEIPDNTKVADPTGNPGPTGTKGSGKGKEWTWKEPRDRWQDKKSRTPGSERHVDRLTKQALADLGISVSGDTGEAPNAKQTELINFVSALDSRQQTELKKIISSRALSTGIKQSPGAASVNADKYTHSSEKSV